MTSDGLRVWIEPDGYGNVELHASVRSQGFSGHGSAWFKASELESFASALAEYPLTEEARKGLVGGYMGEVRLRISAYQIDHAGHIGVHVRIAMPPSDFERPESRHVAEVEFQTTYHELESFSRHLQEYLEGKREDAVLRADVRT